MLFHSRKSTFLLYSKEIKHRMTFFVVQICHKRYTKLLVMLLLLSTSAILQSRHIQNNLFFLFFICNGKMSWKTGLSLSLTLHRCVPDVYPPGHGQPRRQKDKYQL